MSWSNLPNDIYWEQRSQHFIDEAVKDATVLSQQYADLYKALGKQMETEARALIQKYGLDKKEWYKQADGSTIQGLNQAFDKLIADGVPYDEAVQIRNGLAKVSRLEALIKQFDVLATETANSLNKDLYDLMASTYQKVFTELGIDLGELTLSHVIDVRQLVEAVTYNWSGEMFSDRIWANKDAMIEQLRQEMLLQISKGSNVNKLAEKFAHIMGVGHYNAHRLIHTELCAMVNKATVDRYLQSDVVVGHRFMAYLDNRTSKVCRGLDGQEFYYDKEEPIIGTNVPPMHPNCRSCIVPIVKL